MRSTLTTVAVVIASLAAAAPLRAQPKEPEVKPRAAGMINTTTEINGRKLSEWVREIKNPDPALSEVAIRTIMLFGKDASKDASGALIDALSFSDTSLRVNACITLTVIGVDQSHVTRAVSTLARLMRDDPQSIVRFYAAVTLGSLQEEARPAIPDLVFRCHDLASWEIRRAAAYALGKAGRATQQNPLDMRAAKALISLFTGGYADRSAEVRLTAVVALGSMGIPALPGDKELILQGLNHALSDRYKPVVIWAHMGLMADGEPREKHLPAILKCLATKSETKDGFETHVQAIRAIGVLAQDKDAKADVPSLVGALVKELRGHDAKAEPMLIAAVCWALSQMGSQAENAVPFLNEVIEKKDVDESIKQAAKDAIEKINGKPKGKDK
jgi:hypothetical protein